MIRYLDDILEALLKTEAPKGSELGGANITFDLPDAEWRQQVNMLTVNLYLYDIRENQRLSTAEPLVQRSGDQVIRYNPPVRIDCAYCITAWSPASNKSVMDEHRLLSQVLLVLLRNPMIPASLLDKLKEKVPPYFVDLMPPYPTAIASAEGIKNQPEFWGALNQQLKPSLNYVVTLAVMAEKVPTGAPVPVYEKLKVDVEDKPMT